MENSRLQSTASHKTNISASEIMLGETQAKIDILIKELLEAMRNSDLQINTNKIKYHINTTHGHLQTGLYN